MQAVTRRMQHCSHSCLGRRVLVGVFSRAGRACPSATCARAAARIVMGIESSCDDTGVGIVTSDGRVLGEALAGQADIHAPWGGVVPSLAQEAHRAAIDRVVSEALDQAQLQPHQLDAVAVTVGPGLSLCLDVGVRAARAVARAARVPLLPVHHMEAHALVARMGAEPPLPFPFLCLLVSGGHNLLVLVRGVGSYLQLGTTLDDALGEAYDKVARMLGLPLVPHGGAALEALAARGDAARFAFGVPMARKPGCDFSYAGLKTSVRMAVERELREPGSSGREQQVAADIAASFQRVAVQHLTQRVRRGVAWAREVEPRVQHLAVAGGVASNRYVRAALAVLAEEEGVGLVFPPPRWCTDNGVMVAWAGVERLGLGVAEPPPAPLAPGEDAATEWVELWPRWPLTREKHPRASTEVLLSMKLPKKATPSLTEVTAEQLRRMGGAGGDDERGGASAQQAAAPV